MNKKLRTIVNELSKFAIYTDTHSHTEFELGGEMGVVEGVLNRVNPRYFFLYFFY